MDNEDDDAHDLKSVEALRFSRLRYVAWPIEAPDILHAPPATEAPTNLCTRRRYEVCKSDIYVELRCSFQSTSSHLAACHHHGAKH